MDRIRRQAVTVVNTILSQKVNNLRSRADNEAVPADALRKRIAISDLEAEVHREVSGAHPIADTEDAPADHVVQAEFQVEVQRLENLVQLINDRQYDAM